MKVFSICANLLLCIQIFSIVYISPHISYHLSNKSFFLLLTVYLHNDESFHNLLFVCCICFVLFPLFQFPLSLGGEIKQGFVVFLVNIQLYFQLIIVYNCYLEKTRLFDQLDCSLDYGKFDKTTSTISSVYSKTVILSRAKFKNIS